ncbi:MAG: LLM class flavin-dependent oxidoreductase [Candidatus Tectomicrobia bacterium]|uniref:LLM class flavin-dependent oxidoreductase n=1 Tax=Tectimicrobiota bacterium TaxID=2528274 RepID=A0A933LQG1_UNCTE|nr:LLM class flavin-dependent oxidoreductase [Candidatus Tectomicrobia bacterium]
MNIKISAELSHICPLADIKLHAKALEKKGFDRIWVPDTIVSPWEYWIAATLVVENTKRVKVGLGVTSPYPRSPVVLAQALSTLNSLSGGRISLALGKGIPRFLEKAGLKHHDKAVEEAIQIIRGLVRGERVSFQGEVYQIDGLLLRTMPSSELIPIYLAAVGENSWKMALKVADGISTFFTDDLLEKKKNFLPDGNLPVAVLVPFSVKKKDFFPQALSSPEKLASIVQQLDSWGIAELILAYADLEDLDALSSVLI